MQHKPCDHAYHDGGNVHFVVSPAPPVRSKEQETVLLSSCIDDDLRKVEEHEEDEETHDGAITSEQQ